MRFRALSTQILTALFVLIIFNLLVVQWSKRLPSRLPVYHLQQFGKFDSVFIGNSLIAAGVDENEFQQQATPHKGINLGIGGGHPPEQYVILRQAVKTQPHLYCCALGFFDTQLTDSEIPTSILSGNQTASYAFEPERTVKYYTNSPATATAFLVRAHLPLFAEQGTMWGRIEADRRALSSIGMPAVQTNAFGRVRDMSSLEPANEMLFKNRLRKTVKVRSGFSPAVRDYVAEAKPHASRLLFIAMPLPQEHRKRYNSSPEWKEYTRYIRQLVEAQGGEYVDASDWIKDANNFQDVLHMNSNGAKQFTRRMARYLTMTDHSVTTPNQ